MNNRQSNAAYGYPHQGRPSCGMNPSQGYRCQMPQERRCSQEHGQSNEKPSSCMTPPSREPSRKPVMSRTQLLNYINEVSFAKDDILLYLDTHPCDKEALEYCRKHVEMRNKALKEYARHYGPLTIDTTDDAASESWEWVMQPWPWEGGAC